jgi:hypothetical protein
MKDPIKWYKWDLGENRNEKEKNDLYIENFERVLYQKMDDETIINTNIF